MKIVIATYMNWDALYIDGIRKKEDHTLYACDIIEFITEKTPCLIDSCEMRIVDEEWWVNGGKEGKDGYPLKIEDVVFEEEE